MVNYSCEKCGKEFSQKGHYTKHLNKKNPCVVESKVKEMLDKVVEEKLNNLNNKKSIGENDKVNTDTIQSPENQRKKVKYIDLFCGMGSFHYSFQKLGFKCVMASDIYKPAKENYKKNYNIYPILSDNCDPDYKE